MCFGGNQAEQSEKIFRFPWTVAMDAAGRARTGKTSFPAMSKEYQLKMYNNFPDIYKRAGVSLDSIQGKPSPSPAPSATFSPSSSSSRGTVRRGLGMLANRKAPQRR